MRPTRVRDHRFCLSVFFPGSVILVTPRCHSWWFSNFLIVNLLTSNTILGIVVMGNVNCGLCTRYLYQILS